MVDSIRYEYGLPDVYGRQKVIGVRKLQDFVLITVPDNTNGSFSSQTVRMSHEDAEELAQMLDKVLK